MITDEVLTGFRVGPSGYWGLQNDYWVDLPAILPAFSDEDELASWRANELEKAEFVPDLFTFGKVIGGGMPLAALGGSREIMEQLSPLGPVYQAGTLSGNPLATAAGLKTLELADHTVYARTTAVADALIGAIEHEAAEAGVALKVNRAGSLFSVFFGQAPAENGVTNFEEANAQETFRYRAFFHAMEEETLPCPPQVLRLGSYLRLTMIGQSDGFLRPYLPRCVPLPKLKAMITKLKLFTLLFSSRPHHPRTLVAFDGIRLKVYR